MTSEHSVDAFQRALGRDDPVELYERAPCGYLSVSPEGRITKVNRTLLDWTGYTAADLEDRWFLDIVSAGGRIYYETHIDPLLQMQGGVREIALELVLAGGDRLPVLLNATLDRGRGDEPPVVRIALFDATERRSYERELLLAKERAESSEAHARALAQTLQQTLMPPTLPDVPGVELAAAYRPAGDGSEVGGDFYDVFPTGSGAWAMVLGDVCGKGPEAAVVTALARYTLRTLVVVHKSPAVVLAYLNDALVTHGSERFCTVALAIARPGGPGCHVTLALGGHPPPLLVDGQGSAHLLDAAGPLVGVFPDTEFAEHELLLAPGETLLLYTDGITEAHDGRDWYGEERLLSVAAGAAAEDPHALVGALVGDVLDFQAGVAKDDIAVLAFTSH